MLNPAGDKLTRRGVKLTPLGFGAAQLGNLYRETSDDDARAAVDAAWDAGIRYFDTAPHYGLGLSERRLGQALAGRPRDDVIISSKVGRILVDSGIAEDDADFAVRSSLRRHWDFSRDGVLRSVEDSLIRLNFDRLDIAYLHDPDDHWAQASTDGIAALLELRDQGIVRAIGAGMNQSAMLTRFARDFDIDVVMVAGRLTLLDDAASKDLLPAADENGVAVVAAGVYNSGLLSSSQIPDDATYDYQQASTTVLRRARELATVCQNAGINLPAAALQFPLQHHSVVSAVVGMRTPGQVIENAARLATQIPAQVWPRLANTITPASAVE